MNMEVSNWIQQLNSEVEDDNDGRVSGTQMFDYDPRAFDPQEDNGIVPLGDDDSHTRHDNRFIDRQTYYKSRIMDEADLRLAQEPRPWIDPPLLPYATTRSSQPATANEAMMRFKRQADEVSLASHAATWGTRRGSQPSLSDIQSEIDGTLLHKIQTSPRKQHPAPESSPFTYSSEKLAEPDTMMKRSRSTSSMNFTKPLKLETPIKMERSLTPEYGATLGNSSKLDVSSQAGFLELWKTQGGPPVFHPDADQKQPEDRDRDEEDEDEDEDEDSVPMSHSEPIIPNHEGFKAHLRRLIPDMGPDLDWLVSRIAHQQEIRYKNLLQLKIRHLQAVYSGSCSAAGRCLYLGGTPILLDSTGSLGGPREFTSTGDGLQLATDLSNNSSGGEGAITVESFPLGIPMPPTRNLPAEFECQICFRVKKFEKPSDWVKHVHEDLQPFTCTFEHCKEPKSFKRRADLVRHENERHRHLEWWQCQVDDCRHTCYRKDNFLQHLVREHKLPEPKQKTKAAIKKARLTEPAWILLERCHHETTVRPQDEPCKICGKSFDTWKKLTVHLTKHMEHIALPVLTMVVEMDVNPETIVSPVKQSFDTDQPFAMHSIYPRAFSLVYETLENVVYPPYPQYQQPFQATTSRYENYATPVPVTLSSMSQYTGAHKPFSTQIPTPMTSYEASPIVSLQNFSIPHSLQSGYDQSSYITNFPFEYPTPYVEKTSLLVKLKYKKRKAQDVQRILSLKAKPSREYLRLENERQKKLLSRPGEDDDQSRESSRGLKYSKPSIKDYHTVITIPEPSLDMDTRQNTIKGLQIATSTTSASHDLEGVPAPNYPKIGENTCQSIRDWTLQYLSTCEPDSSGELFQASFDVHWNLQNFIQDQYEQVPESIGTVITLSGTANCALAGTCGEYVKANWPIHGPNVMTAVQTALESQQTSYLEYPDLRISVQLATPYVLVKVTGSKNTIVEVVQAIGWMAAALRTSSSEQVQYSELELSLPPSSAFIKAFLMTFKTVPLPEGEKSCWYPLFINPVIARGFPVPSRDNGEAGLEISVEMMAALGGARYAVEFEGGLLLKGLSAMFVPIKRYEGSIQWHLIHNTAKNRLPYSEVKVRCPDRALLDEVGHESLQSTRAFLGWWRTSKTYLGTDDFNYSATTYSSAMPSSAVTKSSDGGMNFSKLLVRNQNMSIGAKDSRLFLSRAGPLEQIMQWAEMMPILLYDVGDKRGWFVRASDVILHMIQTRHRKRPFQIEGKAVRLTGSDPDLYDHAAERAILDMASVKLFQDDVNRAKDVYLSDLVSDIWALLEGLSEMQNPDDAIAENTGQITTDSKLQGFEFMAVVDQKSPIRRKEATLEKSSGGWQSLIHEVNAVVLLAHGFGDLIRPTSPSFGLCPRWKVLPKDKGYMAAGVPLLKRLCEEAGSASPYLHLTPSQLQWHRKSMLFEKCAGKASKGESCDCERLQQVVPKSVSDFMSVNPPGELEDRGCVMFGRPEPIPRPLPAADPPPATNGIYDYRTSTDEVDISADGLFDDPEVRGQDSKDDVPQPVVPLSVALTGHGLRYQEYAASADYRYGAIFSKPPRDVEKFYYTPPPTVYSEERSAIDSAQPASEDVSDMQQLKRANKRYFDVHEDGSLRDSKRIHFDSAPSRLVEKARACNQNGSNGVIPMSVRDPGYDFGTAPIVENTKNRQFVVTLASSDQAESEKG
ncbi:uncharacterized protein PAC_14727 [Phialocephala subalpina]|uniref:C2H2-type domain-containing protein n=1 Tax=Phialocephala subalpina TaxID=576137 RepID=A0A1L7XII1_9HELO|nr:uncharacterized protein PAC_14727 [Phialocephala subalpina]